MSEGSSRDTTQYNRPLGKDSLLAGHPLFYIIFACANFATWELFNFISTKAWA